MEISFKAEVVLTLDVTSTKINHVSTDFNLIALDNHQEQVYLDSKGYPNAAGSKVLSNVLIQGLVGNIHAAHENKYRDSAEHLRWIISELEQGFASVAYIERTEFKENG